MCVGATRRVWKDGARDLPVRKWNSVTTSSVTAVSAVSRPRSS
jgi:hypothetical protein